MSMSLLKKGGYKTYVSSRTANDFEPPEIQNVASSRVYIFGNDGHDEIGVDDSTLEMTELRPRSKTKKCYASTKAATQKYKKTETIDREILSNDSLQSFSLKYGCTVAELKRTNNLYSDQDFFALKTIKIPVQAHGLLTEATNEKPRPPPLKLSSTSGDPGLDNDNDDDDDKSDYEDNMPNGDCVRTVSIRTAIDSPNSFLKHMDNDLKLICKSAPIRKHNLDEVARTLTVNCINPLTLRKQQEKTLGNACGIGWKGIIVTVFVIAILLPGVVAFWYLYLRKEMNDR